MRVTMSQLLLLGAVVGLLHCGGAATDTVPLGDDSEQALPGAGPAEREAQTRGPSPSAPSKPGGPSAPSSPAPEPLLVPKIFVRGFGAGSDLFMGKARHFNTYVQFLVNDGYAEKDLYDLGDYDDGGTMAEMTAEVGGKIEAVMNKYPAGTKFDVFGHSLGGIVALRGVLDKSLESRVRTFVALSAPIYGQDKAPFNCTLGIRCGDIYAAYKPFNGPTVTAYMQANDGKLQSMKLCSEISPDDGTINAPMAGAQFPKGTNVVLPNVTHMQLIKSAEAYEALKKECFAGKL
jgi:pimeloyl-ACP methyl ester carboxylesterase